MSDTQPQQVGFAAWGGRPPRLLNAPTPAEQPATRDVRDLIALGLITLGAALAVAGAGMLAGALAGPLAAAGASTLAAGLIAAVVGLRLGES